MTSLLVFWISLGIGFLIIEMITVTFYGLALSVASFAVALYVWYTGVNVVDIFQGSIFAIVSLLTSFFFPKWLTPSGEEKIQGLDVYIGEKHKVRKVGEDFKVKLDGVDYLVDIDGVKGGDMIEITHRKGSLFYGNILK